MFDLHVHAAPCEWPRRGDDLETARAYAAEGAEGFALKSHFESTVGRAAAVAAATGIGAVGGVVLNNACGGLAGAVVASSLALGGRIVWMPTVDAIAHRDAGLPLPRSRVAAPIGIPPLCPENEPVVRDIIEQVGAAGAVLATGHLSAAEVHWLADQVLDGNRCKLVVTHASWVVPALDRAAILELAERGATVEMTGIQVDTGQATAAYLAELAHDIGPERCILTSDAGQPETPWAPVALRVFADALIAAGLGRADAERMLGETPRRLAERV